MRLSILLFALLLSVSPRAATAQAVAPAAGAAGGSGRPEAPVSRAERLRRIPVRAPLVLPNEAYALFALEPAAPELVVVEPAVVEPVVAPAPAPRVGAVHRRAETVFYDVEGTNRNAITSSLLRRGPELHGRRFFGMTQWEVSAGYRPNPQPSGCGVDDLAVEIAITTHLPRWTADAPVPELSRAWNRFLSALDEHEHGHRLLAEEAAEAIRARLAAASTAGCQGLDGAAQQAMNEVMREYDARHRAYDAETGHGRTQGAVWPPQATVAVASRR